MTATWTVPCGTLCLPTWAVGVDPEPQQDERGPPSNWDGIDPPPVDE
jgi:hypothetical protein